MIITPDSIKLECNCDKQHCVDVKKAIIAPGAMYAMDDEINALGLKGKRAYIYDTNTFDATLGRHPLGSEVVLQGNGLHADEIATDIVFQQAGDADILVGVGSGVLNDIVRYCAAKMNKPFISVPTAASVDGYSSVVAAMTWGGYKKTMPGVAPHLILADTDIFAAAPMRLTRSGVGDIIGKYIALAEWKMANLLTGEYYCPAIAQLTSEAVDAVLESIDGLLINDIGSYERLMYALILSGIAIQLAGNSRPASGAEHHFAHALEVGVFGRCDALHGEKVGVGTYYVSKAYRQMINKTKSAIEQIQQPYSPIKENDIASVYGNFTDAVMQENIHDPLALVAEDDPAESWAMIQKIYSSLPNEEEIDQLMRKLGICGRMHDIGISDALAGHVLHWSPLIRNRLTLMRLSRRLFNDEKAFCEEMIL